MVVAAVAELANRTKNASNHKYHYALFLDWPFRYTAECFSCKDNVWRADRIECNICEQLFCRPCGRGHDCDIDYRSGKDGKWWQKPGKLNSCLLFLLPPS